MNRGKSVYQPLPGSGGNNAGMAAVKDFVSEFIRPTSEPSKVLNEMRPIYVDRAHTFVKEEDKRQQKKQQRIKTDRKLTAREKRRLKLYDIPKEAMQYTIFEPLAKLWQGYMSKLASQGLANFEQKLIKADFHGAQMSVIQSANPTYIGVSGIMVQETLSMFNIITKENKLKHIPKNSSHFNVYIEKFNKTYTIYGPQFVSRPAERAAKKFKPKPSIDL